MTSPRKRSRLFGWWYLAIAAGFVLLGVNRVLVGAPWWQAGLRWLIAAGFLTLACIELRQPRR